MVNKDAYNTRSYYLTAPYRRYRSTGEP